MWVSRHHAQARHGAARTLQPQHLRRLHARHAVTVPQPALAPQSPREHAAVIYARDEAR